jgi:hypothetical protein
MWDSGRLMTNRVNRGGGGWAMGGKGDLIFHKILA